MNIAWPYVGIIGVFICATVAYAFHDGSDPWAAAVIATIAIMLLK